MSNSNYSIPSHLLPFDYEIAKNNPKRIITRGGKKVSNISFKKSKDIRYHISFNIENEDFHLHLTTDEGKYYDHIEEESPYDLFLLPESDTDASPEPKDAKTIARDRNIELIDRNIELMKQLGFEIKIVGGGYQVLKDGIKLYYCSYLAHLQDFPLLMASHVIPYYEKRAYEKGQLDLKKTINNLLSIENHKD